MTGDANDLELQEGIGILKKFDGDLTEEEMETAEPVEVIEVDFVTGKIISHWRKEDN